MIRRFVGLDKSESELIVPATQQGLIILPSPCCPAHLIAMPADFDKEELRGLRELLDEAAKYRRPPQDLLERIDAAFRRICEPHFPRIEEIMRSFFEQEDG